MEILSQCTATAPMPPTIFQCSQGSITVASMLLIVNLFYPQRNAGVILKVLSGSQKSSMYFKIEIDGHLMCCDVQPDSELSKVQTWRRRWTYSREEKKEIREERQRNGICMYSEKRSIDKRRIVMEMKTRKLKLQRVFIYIGRKMIHTLLCKTAYSLQLLADKWNDRTCKKT